uniref:Leucine-rich repeat domain protein n=1 Tax=uncultured Acidobacteria bacterium A11 TaxID=1036854 RepID=F8TTJ1_9BACT|nr:leucine-rich repeat domain protein [uncultured Acidobacteria bacterium A11]
MCLLTLNLRAQTLTASADDVAAVKNLVAAADAWDAKGKTRFDSDLALRLGQSWRSIRDPLLRIKVREFIPALERAAVLRPRLAEIAAATKTAKGTVAFEPGAPQWLSDLVGAESLHLLDRLTAIDLNDRQSPHDKSYKRNDTLVDAWLDRLADLPDLISLDLANTGVAGPGLKVVGTLKNLERLNLTLTPVTDAHLEHLAGLTNLRVLSLASAKCTGEGFRFLGKLKQLENANFHFTPVNDAGLAGISTVTGLERLEIVHCHFTDAGAPHLAKLVNLERLQIGSRDATGAAIEPLTALTKLRELDLQDNQATAEGVRHASRIPSLRVLRIHGQIKDEGAASIAQLSNLEILVANNAGLTDDALDHFARLPRLQRLEIKGNKITDPALARLQQALPALEVVRQ